MTNLPNVLSPLKHTLISIFAYGIVVLFFTLFTISFAAVGDTCLGIADCGWDSIPFIECRNDGAGLQCLCQSGYYGDVGTTTCNSVGK